MKILLKFTWRNIKERKLRTALLVLTVLLSSALFFVSTAISDNVEKMFMERIKRYVGTAEIMIYPNKESPSSYFKTTPAEQFADRVDYIVGVIPRGGIYQPDGPEDVSLNIQGIALEDLQTMNPFLLESEEDLRPFTGKRLIISKNAAAKYGLTLGSSMEIEMEGARNKFKVAGIAQPTGPFLDEGETIYIAMPISTLRAIYDAQGKASVVYIKPRAGENREQLIKDLAAVYRRYTVTEAVSEGQINRIVGLISNPLKLTLAALLFMGTFIIFTSFKVIAMERLPVIGTLRSIGATKRTTVFILLLESLFYGLLGGTLGCGSGIGLLYLISDILNPFKDLGVQTTLDFSLAQLAIAFILAIFFVVFSSLWPILNAAKVSVKEIILGSQEVRKPKRKRNKFLLGILMIAFSLVAPRLAPQELALFVNMLSFPLVFIGVISLVPYIFKRITDFLERPYTLLFGNEGLLALKNVRDSQGMHTNVSMVVIGIAVMLMVNTVSTNVFTQMLNFYKDYTYDIRMDYSKADRNSELRLRAITGVEDTMLLSDAGQLEIVGTKYKLGTLEGIDRAKFPDFIRTDYPDQAKLLKLYEQLDEGRYILLSYALKDTLKVSKGDYLTLKMPRGNMTYQVLDFFNSLRGSDGSHALVSLKYLKMDLEQPAANTILIKTTEEPEEVQKKIIERFRQSSFSITTVQEMKNTDLQLNKQIFDSVNAIVYLTLFIGITGITNNFLIGFLERKRFLAVYRSVGMSKKQIIRMIMVEGLTGGIVGSCTGVLAGSLLVALIPYILKSININIGISFALLPMGIAFIAGIILVMVASLSPAFRTSRLNIIEAIKYE